MLQAIWPAAVPKLLFPLNKFPKSMGSKAKICLFFLNIDSIFSIEVPAFTFIYNSSGKYSITPLSFDRLKILSHCIGFPIFFFDPEPNISIGILDL